MSDSTVFLEAQQTMSFADFFHTATGNHPFPWQVRLYEKFTKGEFPATANIPTGLGKTSIVAVWLIALALHQEEVPRRLVYVVNRRTVVDQTTAEVELLRKSLIEKPELKIIADSLRQLCALPLPSPDSPPLAVSTLRGQFADNREWSMDPTRPAVIIGTVDMIGSGLLFSRYTVGFKLRPHHAAFLAQDALLIHDEAHLEPAFQKLLDSIVAEQTRSNDQRKLRVIELSATTRAGATAEPFRISEEDIKNSFVNKRLNAVKNLSLIALDAGEKERDKLVKFALAHQDTGDAILVFVRTVEHATQIASEIGKKVGSNKVLTLTGTMRGDERDKLVAQPAFKRFLPNGNKESADGTVWLVATSAGEVGINISADHMICDLSTYESMAQRFGRVNRFGERNDSTVIVIHPPHFGTDRQGKLIQTEIDIACERTLALLEKLSGDASPAALEKLPAIERAAAFSPLPKLRVATEIQFDAWALTSIRKPIAARPPVVPYLHGEAEWQPPETQIAWREELDVIHGDLLTAYPPEDLMEDFPLKPHELLRDVTGRIIETLSKIISKWQANHETLPDAWLLNESGSISLLPLSQFACASKAKKDLSKAEEGELIALKALVANATIILPASIGGISAQGLLTTDGVGAAVNADVSQTANTRLRIRAVSPTVPDQYDADYRLIRAIDTQHADEDGDTELPIRYWLWLEAKSLVNAKKCAAMQPETLDGHTRAIVANVAAIVKKLFPPTATGEPDLRRCLIVSAEIHDHGKNRRQWQRGIGNTGYDSFNPETILAKSGGLMRPRNLTENYRHEFGSLADAVNCDKFSQLSDDEKDIALHLVAAHHGRARPHFPTKEIFDYDSAPDKSTTLATQVPTRFARLQRRFGRWGLVWIESILRASDYAASAGINAEDSALPVCCHAQLPENNNNSTTALNNKQTIELRVDVANPGQYFACCGLFELASRIAPDALAHFEQNSATMQWHFTITADIHQQNSSTLTLQAILAAITSTEITAIDPDDAPKTALNIGEPFNLIIDWWRYEGGLTGKLKTWAGQMSVCAVANDMKQALKMEVAHHASDLENILFVSSFAPNGQPYYFDANYAVNAQALDVGFSVDKMKKGGIKLKTATAPAVELLGLIGLQRARPVVAVPKKGEERLYDYRLWDRDLPIELLPAAVSGVLPACCQVLRFANPSRAKDYRAFMPAVFL